MSATKASHSSAGAFLRNRREQRSWTLAAVAQKAGVVKSTLSKWENGRVLPRATELSAVLDALDVPASERALLFQQLGKGVLTAKSRTSALLEVTEVIPVHGDLLRAMRHRALLSQQEAARKAGISQGTLAKWEQGSDWPSAERLHTLTFALSATAEETALLTTGVPTMFSQKGATEVLSTEADLSQLEAELQAIKTRSYFHPFLPHDLWFLSLLARLGPASLREDSLGQRAFVLWAGAIYLYLVWLTQAYRSDTDYLTRLLLKRIPPRLQGQRDFHLWGTFIWAAQQEIIAPMYWHLDSPHAYLQARQRRPRVSHRNIQRLKEFDVQLATFAHNEPLRLITAGNDLYTAFLAALSDDSEVMEQRDTRVDNYIKSSSRSATDIATERANTHYFLGNLHRALELLPEIPAPIAMDEKWSQLDQLRRLERVRFRARTLLEMQEKQYIAEGYHLLEIFHKELLLLPPGSIRTRLGPILINPASS